MLVFSFNPDLRFERWFTVGIGLLVKAKLSFHSITAFDSASYII